MCIRDSVLSDYYYLLKKWEADNSPRTPEEEPHPRFVEAVSYTHLMCIRDRGMAIYAELHYMMSSLMLGEWFE